TIEDAYAVFLRHVSSARLRLAFFNEHYLAQYGHGADDKQRQELWDTFNEALTITRPQKPNDALIMTLTLQDSDPQRTAEWANQYVAMAIQAAQTEIVNTLQSAVQLRLNSVQAQIDTLRKGAQIEQQRRMAQLSEALQLAEAIGLT